MGVDEKKFFSFFVLFIIFCIGSIFGGLRGKTQSDSSGGTVISPANDFDKTLKSIAGTDALDRTFGVTDMKKTNMWDCFISAG